MDPSGITPVLIFLHFLSIQALAQNPELLSLLEFKKGIVGDPTGLVASSWSSPAAAGDATGCPTFFHGVSCDAGNRSVVEIRLTGLGLSGELKFSTLAALRSLHTISLAGNSFSGRLVPSLGSLPSLQLLDLSHNQFYGPVPGRLTELSGLAHLNLSHNNLTGGMPTGFYNLWQLRTIDLSFNGLWGDVSQILAELRYVEILDLSANAFSGSMPNDPRNLSMASSMRYLNLSGNAIFGGFFPNELMTMFKKLEVLDVSVNSIGGQLPSFKGIPSLRILRAGRNQLYGEIPDELFGSTMPLEEIDFSGNGFTGHVHPFNSTSLRHLNLSSNGLSGSLPRSLGSCLSVDLSKNMISGDLSAMLEWEDSLEAIDLSSNALSGSLPNESSRFPSLTSINLSNNSFVGSLSSAFASYPKLSLLDLSLNKLTGPIFSSLLSASTLTSLNLSGNHITGSIPLQTLHSTKSVSSPSLHIESLDLSDNHLSGLLPVGIGNMQRLKLLNLAKNNLSGGLPIELSNLIELEILDLSYNHFNGKIPDINFSALKTLNVSYNEFSGDIPKTLGRFPRNSFFPGNALLQLPYSSSSGRNDPRLIHDVGHSKHGKSRILVVIVFGSLGFVVLLLFVLVAFNRMKSQIPCGMSRFRDHLGATDVKVSKFGHRNTVKSQKNDPVSASVNFSNELLLNSTSRSLALGKNFGMEAMEYGHQDIKRGASETEAFGSLQHRAPMTEWDPSQGLPISSFPQFFDSGISNPLFVHTSDRLAGEMFIFDESLILTADDLSHAPAEILGSSSHGTKYKATIDSGHLLTVKWLRVSILKHKKEFAKEAKRICSIRHQNAALLRGYCWGAKEQERLLIANYIDGDSLALHLHGVAPRLYPPLSVSQRLQVAIDVALFLHYLHTDRSLAHGSLKPTNIILTVSELSARLTDYGLHRLMTPNGISEHIMNLGALGYQAPELIASDKACPTLGSDVYSFGVIIMEMITGRSAGDIMSGQSSAIDLPDWVRMLAREGRGAGCFDKSIPGSEESPRVMEELLQVSLKCILPVDERPNIATVLEDLCSIRV